MTDNNRLRIYNYYHNYIIEYWNKNFINLPKISNLSENRKNKINARLNDFGDEENWLNTIDEIFKKISESEFLSGNNNQGWKCNFDWVFANDKNYLKILEGNYDNKKNKQNEIRRHQDLFNSGRKFGETTI